MRTITALLAIALITPALPGCPPVRGGGGDDDDSSGDDDDSTQDEALEEGFWSSQSSTLISDDCGVGSDAQLSFELTVVDEWGDFSTDWGVDQPLTCSTFSDEFTCGAVDFMVQPDAGTAIVGTLDFDGDVLAPDRLGGVVLWEVTCSGTGCGDSGLPPGTTCVVSMDAVFQHLEDDEPTVPPGDGDSEDDDSEEGP